MSATDCIVHGESAKSIKCTITYHYAITRGGRVFSRRKSPPEQAEIQERRDSGESFASIANVLGLSSGSVAYKKAKRLHQWKQLTLFPNSKGYLYVNLGRQDRRNVAHLVLTAFSQRKPSGYESCHVDGNKLNNAIDNLYWGTHQQNIDDKQRHGTHHKGDRNPAAVLSESAVRSIREDRRPQREVAAEHGVSQPLVCAIKNRTRWSHVT